jgi:hypothetical protein
VLTLLTLRPFMLEQPPEQDASGDSLRRGWLRNGNPPGDFTMAPRCGAKNRRGMPCRCPAMANGRCRIHGGRSTGAKTEEGIRRIQEVNTKHGRTTKRAIEARRRSRKMARELKGVLNLVGRFRSTPTYSGRSPDLCREGVQFIQQVVQVLPAEPPFEGFGRRFPVILKIQ